MRHRLTIPVLLAGVFLVAGACGTEQEPTRSRRHSGADAIVLQPTIISLDLEDQIEQLIPQLFPRPRLALAAFVQFEAIEFLLKKAQDREREEADARPGRVHASTSTTRIG